MFGPILDIVQLHAEESAFLWSLRARAVDSPAYVLSDLIRLDLRLEAHIDGLRVAGDAGWTIVRDAIEAGAAGEIFAVAVIAFESGVAERVEAVLTPAASSLELSRALASALGWLAPEQAAASVARLLRREEPSLRRAGLAAASFHRVPLGDVLGRFASDPEPSVRARALRAAGELGGMGPLSALRRSLDDSDEDCRFWAAWSAARYKDRWAMDVLAAIARSGDTHAETAANVAMRAMPTADALKFQQQLAGTRIGVLAAGALGDPFLIPWLLEQLEFPPLARIAAESFSAITGLNIVREHLSAKAPENFTAGPTEDAEDENVEMDPDRDLPWPEPGAVAKWWGQNTGRFHMGVRHLAGTPIAEDSLERVLRSGNQHERASAALELAIRNPSIPLLNIRSPGFRQERVRDQLQ